MTKNRKAKQTIRAAQASTGAKYTEALRANSSTDTRRAHTWRDDEPTLDQRVRHDLDWADVVLDCRRGFDYHADPPPATFASMARPAPGVQEAGLGTGAVFACTSGITVEAYALGAAEGEFFDRNLTGKPGVVARVTYPDGFRLGYLSWHAGDYNAGADRVWDTYMNGQPDGFARALCWATGYADTSFYDEDDPRNRTVTAQRHEQAVQTGAERVRAAVEDMATWFGSSGPEEPSSGGHALMDLWAYATYGFTSADDAAQVMEYLGELAKVMDAQDAGFDLASTDDRVRLMNSRHWTWEPRTGPSVRLRFGNWLDQPDRTPRRALLQGLPDGELEESSLVRVVMTVCPQWEVVGEVMDSHFAVYALRGHDHAEGRHALLNVGFLADFVDGRPAEAGEFSGHDNGFRDIRWEDATADQRRHIVAQGAWVEAETLADLLVALARAEDSYYHDSISPQTSTEAVGWSDAMAHGWCLVWNSADGRQLQTSDPSGLAAVQAAARDDLQEVSRRVWERSDRAQFSARWDWCFIAVGAYLSGALDETPKWAHVQTVNDVVYRVLCERVLPRLAVPSDSSLHATSRTPASAAAPAPGSYPTYDEVSTAARTVMRSLDWRAITRTVPTGMGG